MLLQGASCILLSILTTCRIGNAISTSYLLDNLLTIDGPLCRLLRVASGALWFRVQSSLHVSTRCILRVAVVAKAASPYPLASCATSQPIPLFYTVPGNIHMVRSKANLSTIGRRSSVGRSRYRTASQGAILTGGILAKKLRLVCLTLSQAFRPEPLAKRSVCGYRMASFYASPTQPGHL